MTTCSHHSVAGSHLRTSGETRFRRLPGTRHHPPAQSQDAVPESCRATGAEGRAIVADNDVSASRAAVTTSRGSCTSVPASGPTAVVTAEADTRTGMLATYGCSRSRRGCGMDAADMLANAVAAGSPFDARPQHHLAPGDVDADGAHRSGWATCSSGPTVDRAPYRGSGRPGIMPPTCRSRADVFG